MDGLVELMVGPLAGPECRRAVSRRWLVVVRTLASLPVVGVVVVATWSWWFYMQLIPGFLPGELLRGSLLAVEGILVTVALVLSPALVAGTLAGEKARGTMELLLTSCVSTREIVVGRLVGRLSIVAVLLAGSLPGLVFLAALCGQGLWTMVWLVSLPVAVAFGAGGMGIGLSAESQRGRDALMATYVLILMLLLAPLLGMYFAPSTRWDLFALPNPYRAATALTWSTRAEQAVITAGFWTMLGLLGLAWASWRLRPGYLCEVGERQSQVRSHHRSSLPPVGERPMLWKELYVERLARFSRFVRWLLILVVVLVLGGTLGLATVVVWSRHLASNPNLDMWATMQLSTLAIVSAKPVSWLLQWGMGLRAAVAIASEREQATWDALLVSPLEGREIVRAKILGSLYAMRGLIAAVLIAWTVQLLCGATTASEYWALLVLTLSAAAFMAAVGVACSLATSSTTRAMALTLAIWLAAAVATSVVAFLMAMVLAIVFIWGWMLYQTLFGTAAGFAGVGGLTAPMSLVTCWIILRVSIYAVSALSVGLYCRRCFDSLAGRMSTAPVRRRRSPAPPKPVADQNAAPPA